jgi:hypothetical protein
MSFLGSLFGGSPKTTTQTTVADPRWQAYLDAYQKQAMGLPGQGPSPYTTQSAGLYNQFTGNLGFGMQTGAQGIDAYMNPYLQDVVGASQADFARQRALAGNTAADQSIADGSFGGSRSAILQAQMLRDVNQNETSTLANLRLGGYQNALSALQADRGQALSAAQYGTTGLNTTGQYMDARQIAMLQPWLSSLQYGQNPTQTTTEQGGGGGIFQKLLGAGLMVAAPFTGGATLGPGAGLLFGGAGGSATDPFQGYNPFRPGGGGQTAPAGSGGYSPGPNPWAPPRVSH